MDKVARGAKAAKRTSLILLGIGCAIIGFAFADQILIGGTFDSTKISGIVIGVICILFAIFYFKMYKKKRNEERQS